MSFEQSAHASFSPIEQHGRMLRRPLGGRLRSFRPKVTATERLAAIRQALVRGELTLNGFNRWRLRRPSRFGWTFVGDEQTTKEVATTELELARREAGNISILQADEESFEKVANLIESRNKRPDLLLIERDWRQHHSSDQGFDRLLRVARSRRLIVHVIAALGSNLVKGDSLYDEAQKRRMLLEEPVLRPLPASSRIENRFGEVLVSKGLHPVPQFPVAQFFLDFAVIRRIDGIPRRLDIEVDGRHWHEESPGVYRRFDQRRNDVLRHLGWRPVRFWADEVEENPLQCVESIFKELKSTYPLNGIGSIAEEDS